MNKRNPVAPGSEIRLMGIDELQAYTGLGRTLAMRFGAEVGAVKRFGSRVLYDRRIIDAAIDQLEAN